MPTGTTTPDQIQLRRLLLWQMGFAAVSISVAAFFGAAALISAAVGAGVCLLANLVFAQSVFQRYRAQDPGALVARIYGAEIIKIVLILTAFSIAFATLEELNLPILLGSYFVVQVLPALFASRPDPRSEH